MVSQKYPIVFTAAVLLLFSGCKATSPYVISMYGENMYFAPRPPETVKVFYQKPPGDFIEMGEITVQEVWSLSNATSLLRVKAAELGADAVYIINTTVLRERDPVRYGIGYSRYHSRYGYGVAAHSYEDENITVTGVAIKYR